MYLSRPTGSKIKDLGEFTGVKLLKNGDQVRLLCGKTEYDGDEIPVEYDGLSAELNKGDAISSRRWVDSSFSY